MNAPLIPALLEHEFHLQPAVRAWLEDNPERAAQLAPHEIDELLSLFGTGGPLTPEGVNGFVALIERKRPIREAFEAALNTHLIDLIEILMRHFMESLQPRAPNWNDLPKPPLPPEPEED